MKTQMIIGFLLFISLAAPAQKVKPCDKWNMDYIQVDPKISNGSPIDKYVLAKLQEDTSLKAMATCMAGLRIYANCNGEFSFEKQAYINDERLARQCIILQHKIKTIMNGVKSLTQGRKSGKSKDLIFKLVVRIKRNGKPVAEILYYS
jgi:hypothetical protein